MKKLFTILTIMISSFFFCSFNVKAATTYEVQEEHIEYIKTDEFKILREKVIEFCNQNNSSYVISVNTSGILIATVFNKLSNMDLTRNKTDTYSFYIPSFIDAIKYKVVDGILTSIGNTYFSTFYLINGSLLISYDTFLDTNIESHNYTGTLEFIIKYNDLSYNIVKNSHIPTLYEIYLDYNQSIIVPEEDTHLEEKAILSNFYLLVIDKINNLVTVIVSNYIYLAVFGIFLLIFVFELIFRRLL